MDDLSARIDAGVVDLQNKQNAIVAQIEFLRDTIQRISLLNRIGEWSRGRECFGFVPVGCDGRRIRGNRRR